MFYVCLWWMQFVYFISMLLSWFSCKIDVYFVYQSNYYFVYYLFEKKIIIYICVCQNLLQCVISVCDKYEIHAFKNVSLLYKLNFVYKLYKNCVIQYNLLNMNFITYLNNFFYNCDLCWRKIRA